MVSKFKPISFAFNSSSASFDIARFVIYKTKTKINIMVEPNKMYINFNECTGNIVDIVNIFGFSL